MQALIRVKIESQTKYFKASTYVFGGKKLRIIAVALMSGLRDTELIGLLSGGLPL